MKSRVAILGMLVAGILFSTAGAGLALSGVPAQHNASISQYATTTATPTPVCTQTPSPGTTGVASEPTQGGSTGVASEPTQGGSTGSGTTGGACSEGGVLPAEANNSPSSGTTPSKATKTPTSSTTTAAANSGSGGVSPAEETQPERQAAAADTTSQLPFTGYAAIPVLLGGLVLLTGGLFLRRRTSQD